MTALASDPLVGVHPSAWHAVVDFLAGQGVRTVFGLPDDDLGLLSALGHEPGGPIDLVLCRNQRNALFMAAGHAVAEGSPACCVVGRGPALANAIPGLVEARAARIPVLLLASATASARLGTGAFQELDQLALVRPAVKWACRVEHGDRLAAVLAKAWLVAASGAPGPVYVEIPDHVAAMAVPVRSSRPLPPPPAPGGDDPHCLDLLRRSRCPVVLVGGGVRHRNAGARFERLADRLGALLLTTASGRGTVAEDHPRFGGLAGLYAPPAIASLLADADLVVALGSRLEETATHGWDAVSAPVVQVNTEPADLALERPGPVVVGDAGACVDRWLDLVDREPDAGWTGRIERARAHAVAAAQASVAPRADGRPRVVEVLSELDRTLPADRILVQENGLSDMWSYLWPRWQVGADAGSVVPGEQTSLGFGAAAAIGVKLAVGERPVVALVGDGAFGFLGPDLVTAAESGAAVLYVVLDNGGYGWLQHVLDGQRPRGSRFGFVGATAGGSVDVVPHVLVESRAQLPAALAEVWQHCRAGRVGVLRVSVALDDAPPLGDDHPEQESR
ncbi:thiamine pyrophosphate-binding protein [Actinokineospora sp.]|uniref:thiamine pyrophosphate-binding protein n=1 Tax=Actinokineospora sp. TaxID=1872133 RepID=UPI0040377026